MSNLKVIIDGRVVMDADPGEWNDNPPPLLTDQLKAGANPDPSMRAMLMPVADAVSREAARQAGMALPPRLGGWTLQVEYQGDDTEITVTKS